MQLSKLIEEFKECSGPYPWREFRRLLGQLGYEPKKAGQAAGARRKYHNGKTGHLIMLDEPHDGQMVPAMVRRLQKELQDKGVI